MSEGPGVNLLFARAVAMRNRIGIGLGLLAVVLAIGVPPLLALRLRPNKPELCVGMTSDDVEKAVGAPGNRRCVNFFGVKVDDDGTLQFIYERDEYHIGPDPFGNNQLLKVHFDVHEHSVRANERRVTGWEVDTLPRSRPPWLDKALKAVGW